MLTKRKKHWQSHCSISMLLIDENGMLSKVSWLQKSVVLGLKHSIGFQTSGNGSYAWASKLSTLLILCQDHVDSFKFGLHNWCLLNFVLSKVEATHSSLNLFVVIEKDMFFIALCTIRDEWHFLFVVAVVHLRTNCFQKWMHRKWQSDTVNCCQRSHCWMLSPLALKHGARLVFVLFVAFAMITKQLLHVLHSNQLLFVQIAPAATFCLLWRLREFVIWSHNGWNLFKTVEFIENALKVKRLNWMLVT